jgi:hypothetical protein
MSKIPKGNNRGKPMPIPNTAPVRGAKVFVQKKIQNLNKDNNKIRRTTIVTKPLKINPNL